MEGYDCPGMVKFIGAVTVHDPEGNAHSGYWIGIELERAIGEHNGTLHGPNAKGIMTKTCCKCPSPVP